LFFSQTNPKDKKVMVKVKLSDGASIPLQGSPYAAGYDLYAAKDDILLPRETMSIKTGISVEMGNDMFALALGRSGLAVNHSVIVHTGTIDPDFRGEIKIIMHNMSLTGTFSIEKGSRIGQIVFLPLLKPLLIEDSLLKNTVRGEKGFGSTGL